MPTDAPTVFVVDDDAAIRDSLQILLSLAGFSVECFEGARPFLESGSAQRLGCLVADIRMPGMDGLELQQELRKRGSGLPVIFITGHGDVAMAVRALKSGAADFIEKPFEDRVLTAAIGQALDRDERQRQTRLEAEHLAQRHATLTPREREVMDLVVEGQSNKLVAQRLGISARTVEIHRARVMEKMRADTLSDLVRMALRLAEA
ncbi:MAG: response regulator transcription factor [Rhodospirillales bacterium]|nr:response regulator transcription factor [Rhodospirillales bacterium]